MCAAYIKGIRISLYFASFLHFTPLWASSSRSVDTGHNDWLTFSSFNVTFRQYLKTVSWSQLNCKQNQSSTVLNPNLKILDFDWQICSSAAEAALVASALAHCSSTISSKIHQRQLFWFADVCSVSRCSLMGMTGQLKTPQWLLEKVAKLWLKHHP